MWSVICAPVGSALGEGLGAPDALDEGVALGVGVAVGVGLGLGLGLGLGVAAFDDAAGEGDALGLGDGSGRLKAISQVNPLLAGQGSPQRACEIG